MPGGYADDAEWARRFRETLDGVPSGTYSTRDWRARAGEPLFTVIRRPDVCREATLMGRALDNLDRAWNHPRRNAVWAKWYANTVVSQIERDIHKENANGKS